MKIKLLETLSRIAAAAFFALPVVAMADFAKTNPVTGETENYTWKFVGTDTWNGTGNWQDSSGASPSGTPAKSGENTWDPILFDGNTININASISVEGWNLRMGLYNGANVTMNSFVKYQGDTTMWMTVDKTSQLTIGGFSGGNITDGQAIKLSVANANGITWNAGLTSGNANNTFEYYLKGAGSVSYQAVSAANHKIKMADVTLTGTSQVSHKALVSFTSSSQTFTADAAIKVLDSNGGQVATKALSTVNTTGTTTLTTDNAVGTCELVQTSTGIVLYWVDGDPASLTPTVYKPSININFTHNGVGLTTAADVGIGEYAVPGTSWSNMAGSNGSSSTIYSVDSTGEKSLVAGASVTVSGALGSYRYTGVDGTVDLRHGYIDDAAGAAYETPKVVVDGIPYYKYQLVLYFSNDTNGRPFGHLTINGTNYKWDSTEGAIVTCEGTSSDVWGSSSGTALTEGGNYLVFPAMENPDGKLTIVGHRWSGTQRMGVAAIQIIEVKPDAGENDLIIEVSGDTTYTVSETKTLTGTVYITGSGTLTLDGSATISAATNNVGSGVTLNVNDARLDATTYTGSGTVVYDGTKPPTGKGWTDAENWSGTVWVKNIPNSSNERKDWNLALYGNANSTLRFTDVNLFFPNNTTTAFPGTVDIDGAGMNVCDGYGGSIATIARLTGSGTLSTTGGSSNGNGLTINDASAFTGTITLTKYKVIIGTVTGTSASGVLQIESGKSITVAGATAPGGFVVNGTLVANGTLASSASAAVTGSGTVVFGGVPSPVDGENETKWWKNAAWTGTVEIKGATNITGTGYAFNDYGNAGSTVKLTNCSGWLTPNYTCVPALEIGGTFSWTDGYSGLNNTFKVGTLKGSGTISIPNSGAATAVWQITDDWSGFTGAVVGNNTAAKRVLVFGSTLPTTVTAGEIYISEGATLNLDNSSAAWWGVGMGFVVDGTVKASSRSKWGGGTYMTLGDTGVLELVSTSNTDDQNTEMGNITGTGTLKFSSSAGWRAFPKTDANMPATTLTIQTELADSLVLPTKNDGETIIGNLAGSKNIRSDWSDNGANGRILTVTQSKDTEWQGKFVSNRTTQFNVVAPATGTPGTLTLSGTQTLADVGTPIPLNVSGSVNLTGTWVGDVTVAGTIGGTGTLTGNLTFSAGSTFKAFASDENGLSVSGSITYPASGTVTVDVSALELKDTDGWVTLMTGSTDLDAGKFALSSADADKYKLKVDGSTLKVRTKVKKFVITIR